MVLALLLSLMFGLLEGMVTKTFRGGVLMIWVGGGMMVLVVIVLGGAWSFMYCSGKCVLLLTIMGDG